MAIGRLDNGNVTYLDRVVACGELLSARGCSGLSGDVEERRGLKEAGEAGEKHAGACPGRSDAGQPMSK